MKLQGSTEVSDRKTIEVWIPCPGDNVSLHSIEQEDLDLM